MRRTWRFAVAVGISMCVLAAGCGKDEDPQPPAPEIRFPSSWVGVWSVELPYWDCDTDSLIGIDTREDSICAGGTLEEFLGIPEDLIDVVCRGSITDTDFTAHCTGQREEFGVVLTINADFTATRQDSVFSGGGTAVLRYDYGNDSDTDCYDLSFDAQLVGAVAPECSTSTATLLAKPLARALARQHPLAP